MQSQGARSDVQQDLTHVDKLQVSMPPSARTHSNFKALHYATDHATRWLLQASRILQSLVTSTNAAQQAAFHFVNSHMTLDAMRQRQHAVIGNI
jgi:hypothetical protein